MANNLRDVKHKSSMAANMRKVLAADDNSKNMPNSSAQNSKRDHSEPTMVSNMRKILQRDGKS